MTIVRDASQAFGAPGIEPRWTQGNKDGVVTAYSADSRIWCTVWGGVVTEVYYPTIDRPQVRDLQYLVSDGEGLFHEEKGDLETETERLSSHSLAYRVTNSDPGGRYRIVKEIICAPHLPCLLQRTRVEGDEELLERLRLYALCAPHLEVAGWGNDAHVLEVSGRRMLAARKGHTWLVVAADAPFSRTSVGYVGASDGWTDLADNGVMDWEFDVARDGNVALTGGLDAAASREHTLCLAVGEGLHHAVTTVMQALGRPFAQRCERFHDQWRRPCRDILPLEETSGDGGNLYHGSYSVLLGHEDKAYPGAFIASMSIPWGEAKGDHEMGGYHLVWTRDMVNTAQGLLAAGDTHTPLRALIYLAASQDPDGGFAQNFWIDGDPHWIGVQLDQVAFPVLLAWRLRQHDALEDFDPYPLVRSAAGFLVRNGPATEQERWEEASGYSPSTLAVSIAALVCAACFARERGEDGTARYLLEYADFLERHVERWTVTDQGTLLEDVPRHYIRIHPVDIDDPYPDEDPNRGELVIANRPPPGRHHFPAREIVDAGFLELVRYGIRAPDDPLVRDSLRVVDEVLRVETPVGPCWRRYNRDGYGQRADGGPFEGHGVGRAWPLLTGERGHYELAAGGDPEPWIRAMEGFASPTGMLPEQVWDEEDRPDLHLHLGGPTGAAMPLAWAHAEYLQLLRSAADGEPFPRIDVVAERYLRGGRADGGIEIEVWKPNRRVRSVRPGAVLRIQAPRPFRLVWSDDDWERVRESDSEDSGLGIEFVDLPVSEGQEAPSRFTFFWTREGRWEGQDHAVAVDRSG